MLFSSVTVDNLCGDRADPCEHFCVVQDGKTSCRCNKGYTLFNDTACEGKYWKTVFINLPISKIATLIEKDRPNIELIVSVRAANPTYQ